MAQKTSLVCVLNVSSSMDNSKLKVAKALLAGFATQKVIASKTFELGIITYGSSQTSNHLNEADSDQYLSVEEICPLRPISIDHLSSIRRIESNTDTNGDIIDGIVVGYDILKKIGKAKCNRLLLLITDGQSPVEGIEDLETIVNEMTLDCDEIKYAKADDERVKNCIVLIAFIGDSKSSSASVIVKENAKLLQNVADLTGGIFVQGETLENLLPVLDYRGMGTRPQTRSIILELSPALRIPCIQWSKISAAKLPSLKKQSESYDPIAPGDTGSVKRDTSYLVPSLDDQETTFEDRVKGYRYGSSFIPVSGGDDLFEIPGEMGIKLIGFLAATKIKRHHFLDGPVIIQGAPGNFAAESAIIALGKALRSTVNVALCRYLKKDNGDVIMMAVLPPSADDGTLIMHRLPCIEDVRDASFPPLSNKKISKEQKSVISNFINAITIQTENIVAAADPTFVNFHLELEKKATDSSEVLYSIGTVRGQTDEACNRVALQAVKEAFPLVVIESKQNKPKKYWSDITSIQTESVTSAGEGIRNDTTIDSDGATKVTLLDIGTVSPVEDFNAIVEEIGSNVALQKNSFILEEIIINLITVGSTGAYFRKAAACLMAYRATSVSANQCDPFNGFLRGIKNRFSKGLFEKAWNEVQKSRCTLISASEVSSSKISAADSDNFLSEADPVIEEIAPVKMNINVAEADFFDDME